MEEEIIKIINKSVCAPSGENSQPWTFVLKGQRLEVYNLPDRDRSLYNFNQYGSYVAHGALLENISILSNEEGLDTKIDLFPDIKNPDLVATVYFNNNANTENSGLSHAVLQRCTNRKKYKNKKINLEQETILNTYLKDENDSIKITEEKEKINKLAKAASVNEKIVFSNQKVHKFFFEHVSWTKIEDDAKKIGFYIKTLELPLPVQAMFKLLKNWKIINTLNKIGLNKKIVAQSFANNSASQGIGVVLAPDNSPFATVQAGRKFQHLWVLLTKLGFSLQPISGALFFMHSVKSGEKTFSDEEKKEIFEANQVIRNVFDVTTKVVVMMFRFGDGGVPTARTSRFSPEIKIIRST